MKQASERSGAGHRAGTRPFALALIVGSLVLAGCAMSADSADEGGSAGTSGTDDWLGGQTGSLMPRCGVPEAALDNGVPGSSGIVIYTSECTGGLDLAELSLRGPDGEPVAFDLKPLGDGAVLVTFAEPPAPGSYSVGGMVPLADGGAGFEEEDAGALDDDAGSALPDDGEDALSRPASESQSVAVLPAAAAPTALGELGQPGGSCDATVRLAIDPSMAPHVGVLQLELFVDGEPKGIVVPYGGLDVSSGELLIELPRAVLDALAPGEHVITLQGEVAALPGRFESGGLAVTEPCRMVAQPSGGSSGASTCSATGLAPVAGVSRTPLSLALLALALARLRKRRRRSSAIT